MNVDPDKVREVVRQIQKDMKRSTRLREAVADDHRKVLADYGLAEYEVAKADDIHGCTGSTQTSCTATSLIG